MFFNQKIKEKCCQNLVLTLGVNYREIYIRVKIIKKYWYPREKVLVSMV